MFDSNVLADRVAVVTGGGRGLGLAISRSLAEAGARVTILDSSEDNLATARQELASVPGGVSAHQLDVSDPAAVDEVFARIASEQSNIDILVNNAGTVRRKLLADHSVEDWRLMMSVNLDGTFYCSKAALRSMTGAGRGTIINFAAVAAFAYTVEHAAYAAAKAGVVAFTRDLAYEVGPMGVRVNAIAPGFIRTPLLHQTMDESEFDHIFRLGRWGEPEDIANTALFLASDASSFITGQTITVAGGCDLRVTHASQSQ
jgi:NAD(P)-dependent dehydrogenase (short-subunit alcohol dehydrogenase family)